MRRFVAGIDLGFGETALVFRELGDYAPLEWFTWTAGTGDEFSRAMAMAQCVVDALVLLTSEYELEDAELLVCIEMHVWKQNAVTYRKQTRLLEETEAGIHAMLVPLVNQLMLIEHMPGTAKRLATGRGSASKADMVKAAARWFGNFKKLKQPTREALADAWAHSLVGEEYQRGDKSDENIVVRNLTDLTAHHIEAIERGNKHGCDD